MPRLSRVGDHANERAKNVVVGEVQGAAAVAFQIASLDRELDPDLGFGRFTLRIGHLTDAGA
jgi:hypothetical protein